MRDQLQQAVVDAEATGDPVLIHHAYKALGTHRTRIAEMRRMEVPGIDHVELIVGDRQTGKTTAAVDWVIEGRSLPVHRTLIVSNRSMAGERIRQGLTEDEVVSWRQLPNRGRTDREYAVDETADILAGVLGVKVGLLVVCTASSS